MNLLSPSMNSDSTTAGIKRLAAANETLLQNLLNGSLILGTILFFLNMYAAFSKADYISIVFVFITYAILFLMTFARMLPYHIRANSLALAYYLMGVVSVVQSGVNANGLLYFLICVLIVGLLEEGYYWGIPIAVIAVTVSLLGYSIQIGLVEQSGSLLTSSTILYWVSTVVNLLFLIFLATAPLSAYLHNLRSSVANLDQSNATLLDENQQLVQKRIEFENTLDRRRLRLVTTRQISREISQQTDLEILLRDSVELIRSQLGYYHAAIFLSDERGETASLKAATGEGGKALLERNFRIRIHDTGIISFVITHGEPHIASNLTDELVQNHSNTMASTESELTMPLRIGQRIIGALDVQSDQKNAFGDEDIEVLQGIADQLSTVIDKTMQIQQLNQSVTTLEENYRSYTRNTWRSHLQNTQDQLNFTFAKNELESGFEPDKIAEEALTSGETIVAPAGSELNPAVEQSVLAVPILLRDQVLGVLNLKYAGQDIPDDLAALVSNASDRLALALENARLLEQIQERADREHLVSDISAKVRAATDIDSILRTAAAELGKSLGVDEVRIQLKSADSR